jgi:hypothetical protein
MPVYGGKFQHMYTEQWWGRPLSAVANRAAITYLYIHLQLIQSMIMCAGCVRMHTHMNHHHASWKSGW